jgi:thiol-disulfide isomerase/thioredoxin
VSPTALLRPLAFALGLACLAPAAPAPALAGDEPAGGTVELTQVPYKEFRARVENPPEGVKYTIVDAWATYCPPCMENFPHIVAMHKEYGDKGLRCMSLSMDDPLEADDVAKAEAFLKEKGATFSNFIIDGDPGDVYEALDVSAIPAVFVFDAKGKEIKRFTLDDVDNQFTYEQVDEYVEGLLGGK